MDNALLVNTVNDRLLEAYGSAEQHSRYLEGIMSDEELRELLRPVVYIGIPEIAVGKHLEPREYNVPPGTFKVLERKATGEGFTPERHKAVRELQDCCATPVTIPGLKCTRKLQLVEKSVVSDGKEIDVVPMALIEVTISDTQGRSPKMVMSRRVRL